MPVRTLDERQRKHLKIYDNLRHDAKTFTPTAAEPENYAKNLLDDFMQNDSFKESMRSIATDFGRSDLLTAIDTYRAANPPIGMADVLMQAVDHGNDELLVDLIKKPVTQTYSLTELNKFWNIASNVQQQDPELYTHLAADKRYVDIFEQTAAANEYHGEGIEKLRQDVRKAHETANKTLDDTGFDKFQMHYTGMSENIYDLLENSDFETIGKSLTDDGPKTIFSGLKVAEPLPVEKLTATAVSIDNYYNDIQKTKEPVDIRVDVPELSSAALQIEQEVKRDTAQAALDNIKNNIADLPSLTGQFTAATTAAAPQQAKPEAAPAREPEPQPEDKKYAVQKGDNLWKIAKDQYGLKNYKDIMRAVEHIAAKNGLDQGVKANRIAEGSELKMPSKDDIASPLKKLDWVALDADVANKGQKQTLAFAQ